MSAKEKEMENLRYFQVSEEIEEENQDVLGTRYVLTEKPDGSLKARFVVKGYWGSNKQQSDSPTAERERITRPEVSEADPQRNKK